LFPDVPVQFSVSGGTPGYSVFSSNSIVLPIDPAVSGTTFTAIPKNVTADTPVTITVRDSAGKTNTAAVTVRPAVLNNSVTFTALPPDGIGCGTNILCSGGNAQVLVTALLNGTVLQNRSIRFDVYQGDFQFVTPATGVLVNSITVNTDERGEAVVRLAAAVGAPTQVATLTITDIASGLVRRFNFSIVAKTLSVLPSASITIKGAKGAPGQDGKCPFNVLVAYTVFGGTPPYTVVSPLPQIAFVSPSVVTTLGGTFTATLNNCTAGIAFNVTDSVNTSVETALLIGVQGDKGDALPTVTAPKVSPSSLTFLTCSGTAGTVNVTGTGTFTATIATPGGSPGITITVPSNTMPASVTVARGSNPFPATQTPSTVSVNFANSAGTDTLVVTNAAGGNCPVTATLASVTVTVAAGPTHTATSTIAGGVFPYPTATSSNPAVATVVTPVGNTVTITGVAVGTATITVTDSVGNPAAIAVTVGP
jgi:hypothetical protein